MRRPMVGALLALAVALAALCPASAQETVTCSVGAASAVPCRNNGTCHVDDPTVGNYCTCTAGFVGSLCELRAGFTPTPCPNSTNFCMYGGSCPVNGTDFCDCSTALIDAQGNTYRGAHCEYPAVRCGTSSLYCYNGGTCYVTSSGTNLCQCPAAWTGGFCQKLLSLPSPPPPPTVAMVPPGSVAVPTWVAAPIIVGIVLMLGCGGCVLYMARRERRGEPVFQKIDSDGAGSPTRRQELTRHSRSEEA